MKISPLRSPDEMPIPELNDWLGKITDGDPAKVLHGVPHKKLVEIIAQFTLEIRRLAADGSSYDSLVSLCDAQGRECRQWEEAWSKLSVSYRDLEHRMLEIHKISEKD